MNLSFVPGDLHLSKNTEGLFVLKMARREILNTKSEHSALAQFHSIRAELAQKFPTRRADRRGESGASPKGGSEISCSATVLEAKKKLRLEADVAKGPAWNLWAKHDRLELGAMVIFVA